MMAALALIGVAALGYVWIAVRTAWTLVKPNREFIPGGYQPSGIPFERVTFQNRTGLRIAGWTAIREDAPGTVIFCHGVWANHREMESRAELLWNRGFSVMTFDFQGCGESEGRYTSLGLREVDDLFAAVDYLAARGDAGPLGVVGNSMGGAVAIMAAARDERMRAVVTDGAFAAAGRDFVGYAFHGGYRPAVPAVSRRHGGGERMAVGRPARSNQARRFNRGDRAASGDARSLRRRRDGARGRCSRALCGRERTQNAVDRPRLRPRRVISHRN